MTDIVARKSTLPELAEEIGREVEQAERAWRDAVGHAIRAGELLVEAKAKIKHGEWLSWLEANFPGSARSAQDYMRLAANAEDARRVAHLGVRGALKQLAAPKTPEADDDHDRGDDLHRELAAVLEGVDVDNLDELPPRERWDLEDRLAELRERFRASLTPFERYWLKHRGIVSSADRLEAIRETCEVGGFLPLIEDLSDLGGSIRWIWVGYIPADADALHAAEDADEYAAAIGNPLIYHPGWAHYCRDQLGEDVRFATVEEMPNKGPAASPSLRTPPRARTGSGSAP